MSIGIYTLTSRLHDPKSTDSATKSFLSTLTCGYNLYVEDFTTFGQHDLNLVYVRTGGTEGLFLEMLKNLKEVPHKFYLLTSGTSNSLAASMEILSYLNNSNMSGEILHGDTCYINNRIKVLEQVSQARHELSNMKLGVIGKPSDWLISSGVDYEKVKSLSGITLVDIPMQELIDTYNTTSTCACADMDKHATNDDMKQRLEGAVKLYDALKVIVDRYHLSGFTIRCFDLLTSIKNTGCLALAKFNANGIIATCEGDIPAMLSMAIAKAATGFTGFQANPATINPTTGEMLFAHCTIPFNMVDRYEFDTHFESGLGIGIRGYSSPGPVTIFKTAGNFARHCAAEGSLLRCQAEANLCRTQQVLKLNDPNITQYFLTKPIGNHHIIVPGHHKQLFDELINGMSTQNID